MVTTKREWRSDMKSIGNEIMRCSQFLMRMVLFQAFFSFPTFLYFKNGAFQYKYEGDPGTESLVNFMKAPTPEKAKKPEKWQ